MLQSNQIIHYTHHFTSTSKFYLIESHRYLQTNLKSSSQQCLQDKEEFPVAQEVPQPLEQLAVRTMFILVSMPGVKAIRPSIHGVFDLTKNARTVGSVEPYPSITAYTNSWCSSESNARQQLLVRRTLSDSDWTALNCFGVE